MPTLSLSSVSAGISSSFKLTLRANILTAPLRNVLKNEEVMKLTKGVSLEDLFIDTEYMQTVVLILTTAQEKEFLDTYHTFGEDGKPAILPKSARKLFADAEGYLIYSVVVLKKFIPALQQVCRENRYTLRFFDMKEAGSSKKEDDEEVQLIQYEAEEKKIKADLLQWCRPSYSELASEWVHLKAMRVYVESVLRYGLRTAQFSFIVFVGVGREGDV